ncbi:MAG: energy transducer TonB [Bryobacteraceae bacterium]
MFEQSTLPNAPRRWWATCIGLSGEALLVASLALAPLIWPQVIPRVAYATALATPGPPPAPPPKGSGVRPQRPSAIVRTVRGDALLAPAAVPIHAAMIVDPPPEVGNFGVPGGVEAGVPGGVPGVLGSFVPDVRAAVMEHLPEPVHRAPPVAPVTRLIRRGGDVNPAEPIFRPDPVYPPIARSMRVSGVVELVGVIGADGRIKELRVKSGHPLLARAALDAVARWIYKPTLLNGTPVEVEAPITVTFRLN